MVRILVTKCCNKFLTDGISEGCVGRGRGEDRMIDAVWSNRMASAKEIIGCLMTAADTFVADTPQYDDMTLIVARLI
jgi:serine phosphatase RsbU (regulator of sigma subunit)